MAEFVAGGRLIRGAHGLAGEVTGHIIVVARTGLRADAGTGMLEQVASGLAIARAGRRAVAEEPGSTIARLAGGDPLRATGELVTRGGAEGDAAAVAI